MSRDGEDPRQRAQLSAQLDAAEIARLTAIVDLPSLGHEDVIWMTLGGDPRPT